MIILMIYSKGIFNCFHDGSAASDAIFEFEFACRVEKKIRNSGVSLENDFWPIKTRSIIHLLT